MEFCRLNRGSGNRKHTRQSRQAGAITIVEALIVIAAGTLILVTWLTVYNQRIEMRSAHSSGRLVAAYSAAVANWLATAPPAVAGEYDISDLQDCDDETGARFLPCAYRGTQTIAYATDDEGNRVSLDDLSITVTLPPEGPAAVVDFGVWRSGADDDNDSLPDPRPDLAALALQGAQEDSAAGALSYFEIEFARNSPEGLILDTSNPAYSAAEVANLSRLRARVGSIAEAPFLRVDGSNEMEGSITFVNGVIVRPEGDDLEVETPGEIRFESPVDVGEMTISSIEVDDSLEVSAEDGVTGEGFNRLDQADDVERLDGEIATERARITILSDNLDHLQTDMDQVAANLTVLTGDVQDNRTAINANIDTLNDHETRINHLEDEVVRLDEAMSELPTLGTCSPTYASALAEYKLNNDIPYSLYSQTGCLARGNSVVNQCNPSGWEACCTNFTCTGAATITYEGRNTETLACESKNTYLYRLKMSGCIPSSKR